MPTAAQSALSASAPSAELKALLDALVAEGLEVGISVTAYHWGEKIAEARSGRIAEDGPPVGPETLFPIFSVVKGIIAVAAHLQAERGHLDIDAPLASYWPEFAQNGKEAITLRDVFSHRAGIPQMPPSVTLEDLADWDRMTGAIAALQPIHPPGEQSFYHGMTYGWIIGEAVRRTDPDHRLLDQFVTEEIARPLGANDLLLTVSSGERERVAHLSGQLLPEDFPEDTPLRMGIPKAVDLNPANFNRADVQAALIPAVGGYATSDSVARVFAMLAGGGALGDARLLSQERVRNLSEPRANSDAPDPFLGGPARLSRGGFMLGGAKPAVGPHEDTLFSIGAGGSIAWADRTSGLAVSITHNRMYPTPPTQTDPQLRIGNLIRRNLIDIGRSSD